LFPVDRKVNVEGASISAVMIVDVFLPSVLFLIGVIVVFLYSRLDKKVDSLFGGQELHLKHIVLLVVAIGTMVTVTLSIPQNALLGIFLFAYVSILFLFTFLFVPKWYLAVVPPLLFILSFFYFWNIYLFNFFAITFGIGIALYMGKLFRWKTTAAFAALLTIMDSIQVFVTGHMGEAFETAIGLNLPVAIILPTFPSSLPYPPGLGLGDVFLFGLLSIQTTRKYGKKFGLISTASMTIVFFLLETVLLNSTFEFFPATVLVVSGWLTALAARLLYNLFTSKREVKV
jgi:hypothetical protein